MQRDADTRTTLIKNRSNNRESRQQRGMVAIQQNIQRSKSLQYNTEEIESDTDSNLSALFQDSDDFSVETEQEAAQAPVQVGGRGMPRLATQYVGAVINQLKPQSMTCNPCLYVGYYKGNRIVTERQMDDLKVPLDDMYEKTDSAKGELFDHSDRIEAVVSGERLVKSVSVPNLSAEKIHGPQCSTLQALKIVR